MDLQAAGVSHQFRANGKLMFTGEYLALKGATVLSVPTQRGQTLAVHFRPQPHFFAVHWRSLDVHGNVWFEAQFNENWAGSNSNSEVAAKLKRLLTVAFAQRNLEAGHYAITTQLEFPNNWGLGSSSSLIACVAQWSGCNPYHLFFETQNGSGYDVAAALHNTPLLYQKTAIEPVVQPITWKPPFFKDLAFVHLQQKQDSHKEVQTFLQKATITAPLLAEINALTHAVIATKSLAAFEVLMARHEQLLSGVLNRPTVKEVLFPDYPGLVKSLGAWGGDFVLVSKALGYQSYFETRGYTTQLDWEDMVL